MHETKLTHSKAIQTFLPQANQILVLLDQRSPDLFRQRPRCKRNRPSQEGEAGRLSSLPGGTFGSPRGDWYDVELTYTSNAIEENTLTRSETAIVLKKRLTVHGKPLKDHREVVDHLAALPFV